jgi:hypothetical protein
MGILEESRRTYRVPRGRFSVVFPYAKETLASWERAARLARKLGVALDECSDMYPSDAPPEIAEGIDRGLTETSAILAALDFRIEYIRKRIAAGEFPTKPLGRPQKSNDEKFKLIAALCAALAPFDEKMKLTSCGRFADTYRIMWVALGHKEPQDTTRDFRAYKAHL